MPEDWQKYAPSDRMLDFLDRKIPNAILTTGTKLVCVTLGHDFDRDMCGKPEHDHCIWCGKVQPWSAD